MDAGLDPTAAARDMGDLRRAPSHMSDKDFTDSRGKKIQVWVIDPTHDTRVVYFVYRRSPNDIVLLIVKAFVSTHGKRQYDYNPDKRVWNAWRIANPWV